LADLWGIGILLVEHDMEFVSDVCDDVLVLDFGKQIAGGNPREIERNPAVIRAFLGEASADGDVKTAVES
jgi:ABC-type branched-subunit amino acid transport system ATPase component